MVDRGYQGVTLTRTIAYDRVEDVVLVWDRLDSDKPVRASQQWGLGRDRSVRLDADAVHTNGPGANVSMLFTSGGAPLDLARGRNKPMRGWNSLSYGELSPAPSVRATQKGTLAVLADRARAARRRRRRLDGYGDGVGQRPPRPRCCSRTADGSATSTSTTAPARGPRPPR